MLISWRGLYLFPGDAAKGKVHSSTGCWDHEAEGNVARMAATFFLSFFTPTAPLSWRWPPATAYMRWLLWHLMITDCQCDVGRHGHEGQSGMIVSTITISQTIGDDVKQLQPIHGPHDRVSAIACRVHQLYIIVVQQHS